MKTTEHIINLEEPIEERWGFLAAYKAEIDELLECYLKDFEGSEYLFESIGSYKDIVIPSAYLDEIKYVSSISKFDENQVLIAILYYDVVKLFWLHCLCGR